MAAPLLVVLVLVAVVGPAASRLWASLAGAAVSLILVPVLVQGWADVGDAIDEFEHDAEIVASRAPENYVSWSTSSEPRVAAAAALAILVVVDGVALASALHLRRQDRPGAPAGDQVGTVP